MADTIHIMDKSKDDNLATAAIVTQGLQSAEGIIRELLRASMSNPLMGCVVGLVIADVLAKLGVITEQNASGIRILIFSAAGITLGVETLKAIESIIPWSALGNIGSTAPASLTQPSGQVLVFGEGGNDQLNALLTKLKGKVG